MEFHVFQRTKEGDWKYNLSYKSEIELRGYLLNQESEKMETEDFFIIYGADVPLVKKECLGIKKK